MASLSPLLSLLLLLSPAAEAARFTCNATARATCQSLVGYAPPNATTLAAVKFLFQLRSLRGLLAANSFPLSTPASHPVPAASPLRVRLPCSCSAGAGRSFRRPLYRVRAGDGLDAIARGPFAGLVTREEIAAANNISDPNRIEVGRELWIPLPCSCDPVGGEAVVHYAHVAAAGSSVEGIAADFGTTEEALMGLNGISDPKNLHAGQVLDVPLRVCSSSISSLSVDRSPRIPNGSSILTARNCIMCTCSSSSWQLDCNPTQGISSVCPAAKCGDLYLGNTTSTAACESTKCSYAGYTNSSSFTILANLTTQSICNISQPSGASALRLKLQWSKSMVLLIESAALLCFGILFHQ